MRSIPLALLVLLLALVLVSTASLAAARPATLAPVAFLPDVARPPSTPSPTSPPPQCGPASDTTTLVVNAGAGPTSYGQSLAPNQTWRITIIQVQGPRSVGGQFVDSLGDNLGGSMILGTGAVAWLYNENGRFSGSYVLQVVNTDVTCHCPATVRLNSQVCQGFTPFAVVPGHPQSGVW